MRIIKVNQKYTIDYNYYSLFYRIFNGTYGKYSLSSTNCRKYATFKKMGTYLYLICG